MRRWLRIRRKKMKEIKSVLLKMDIIQNEYKKDLIALGLSTDYISRLENGSLSYKTTESSISITNLLFYDDVTIKTADDFCFEGRSRGEGSINTSGGCGFGKIYIIDDNIYSKTVAFSFIFTPIYIAIVFTDEHGKILGHGQYGWSAYKPINSWVAVNNNFGKWIYRGY